MTIAREAWLLILVAVAAALLAYLSCGPQCAAPLIVIALIIGYLFRDPPCRIPPSPLGVVSPVDGRVLEVGEVNDPFLGRKAVKITVRMLLLGPFVMRSPTEGQVLQQWHLPEGLDPHLMANVDAATLVRDSTARQGRYAIWVQTDEKDDVVVVLRGVLISQRLRCGVQVGERIGQGKRCGLIQFAATADVYVPAKSRIEVKPGDSVKAGSAIIAALVHKGSPTAAMAPE